MILSQKNIEEIAVAVIRDFQKSFFGSEADVPARFALPTPIDQFASDYLNLKVSFQKLSSDGSIYGLTAYVDTEYQIEVDGSQRSIFLKTKAAHRDVPLPDCLTKCLREAKETSTSDYVVANSEGEPLSYTQFKRLWQYIVTRTVKERSYYRYENGKRVKHTVKPVLGERAAHNGKVVYSLDFEVTPHLLRHTYITNLIHASVDPKTVQYLAGHENSKITMDIYAKAKYNRPDELAGILEDTFTLWDAE